MHLPVAPGCNIECRSCDRRINEDRQVPGNSSTVIKPEEACSFIKIAREKVPELTVVGIAGPGDTLATPYALETFRLVSREFPDLIKCMSTNGLLLDERAQEIIDVGIETLTVTVNSVRPEVEAKINEKIIYHGKVFLWYRSS
ncbi:MAG: radical SAM protein [Treponema sp.]